MRSRREFLAAKHISGHSIWIDTDQRAKKEDPSLAMLSTDYDIIIDNNGMLGDFRSNVLRWCEVNKNIAC